jgi:chemotaxis protein CheD
VNQPRTTLPTSIRMGEMAVASTSGVLRTLLGSCVGIALYDRRRRVGGLAHVVLPDSRALSENPGKYVDTAIPALLAEMQALHPEALRLSARIAGGAQMFAAAGTRRIGDQNVEATEALLKTMRIPIVGRHCGGSKGRRMTLDVATGTTRIEIVGCEPVEI